MKKKISIVIVMILALTLLLCGCDSIKYGDSFDTLDALKTELKADGLDLLYPTCLGCEATDSKTPKINYVSIYDNDANKNIGYKIYSFASPFNTAIYCYKGDKNTLQCEDESSLDKKDDFIVG